LLSGPRFLLMDEPLASLDAERRRGDPACDRARCATKRSLPILYVSHDRAEVDRLASSIVLIGE
jgi:molybdate transport system ATP-binding protein